MCQQKKRLIARYEELQQALGKVLTALNQQAGTLSKGDHEARRHGVEVARVEMERARIALDSHVTEHRC